MVALHCNDAAKTLGALFNDQKKTLVAYFIPEDMAVYKRVAGKYL